MKIIQNFFSLLALLAITLGLFCSCKRAESPTHGPVMKISVFADGRLQVDGTSATIDSLKPALQKLSGEGGVVWYYREAGPGEPPAIVTEVMQAIGDARLPVRLSTDADFKDVTKAESE